MVQSSRSTAYILLLPGRPTSAPVKVGRPGRRRMYVGDESVRLLAPPLLLELCWRQVAQRRVNPFLVVHRVQEAAQLPVGVGEVLVLRQLHLFFLDGTHQPLGVTVLPWFAHGRHAELRPDTTEAVNVVGGGVLHALVGVVDL